MRRIFKRTALLAAGTLVLLVGAPAAGATFPGSNGRIAFESSQSGMSQIYTMDPDGSNVVRLTNGTGADHAPSWSADGRTVVFDRTIGPDTDIYAINADGTGERRLTTTGVASVGTWSPDGSRIAFTQSNGPNGQMDIFTMNADGSNVVNVTNTLASEDKPSWSPNGARLAFMSDRNGVMQIFTANADGTGVTQLTTVLQGDNEDPDWSPDGTRIAFMSNRDSASLGTFFQIYTMDATGGGAVRVSSEPTDAELPSWSPDGTKLLFTSLFETGMSIVVTNVDGSGRTEIASGLSSPFPHWQPLPVPYAFAGYFAPVENLPTVNVVGAGRAIPVKFSLGGDRGLSIFAAGSPSSQRIACDNSAPLSTVTETVNAGASTLSYDSATGRYTYVWKTDVAWARTCRQFVMTLADGTSHPASFRFK
jgi:Tol biopolymer transport system component